MEPPTWEVRATRAGWIWRKPASARAQAEAAIFDELKTAIYGAGAGQHAEGEWTETASEIFRKNPKWAKKFFVMRKLTDMVMGDPNFLPNPCAISAPLTGPAAHMASFG